MVQLAALVIDVEPDPRLSDDADPRHWRGFRATLPFIEGLRAELSACLGEAPTFGWMLRMDPQIRKTYGDAAWIWRLFRKELAELQARGDEIGLHTHLYRQLGPAGAWTTDLADPDWRKLCILEATDTYRRCFGEACGFHSFGDRWLSEDTLDVLEEAGIRLELTPEPGLTSSRIFSSATPLLGRIPDFLRCPHELWRPARNDFQRADPKHGRELHLLPLAMYKMPLYFEPGRQLQRLVQRALGEPWYADVATQSYQRVSLTSREYVLQHGFRLLQRAHAPRTLHFVVRNDAVNCPRVRRRIAANFRWLASGASGYELKFVSPLRLLRSFRRDHEASGSLVPPSAAVAPGLA